MGTQERICRFCLKICGIFEALEGNMKAFLDRVLPKINLVAVREPVMCINCAEMLVNSFGFKADCLYKHNFIVSFAKRRGTIKLDLKDVHPYVPENQGICGFCISPVNNWFTVSLNIEREDVMLEKMIEQCLSELDLSIINKPVICVPCCRSLESCFYFVTKCLMVEEKIKTYCETLGSNSKDQIELSSLLRFTMRNVTASEIDGSSVDIIKVEKQFCEERDNADERETGKERDIFKSEQTFPDFSENVKEEFEPEDKSCMDMLHLKINNEDQFTPKNMMACEEEGNGLDEGKNCDERETGKERDIFKLEQIFPDFSENIKEEVEPEDKSFMDMLHLKINNEDQFTPKNMVAREEEGNDIEEGKNSGERETDKEHDIFKLEQSYCDISENIKEEVEPENESFNEDQFTLNNMMGDKADSNNVDMIKMKETFCDEFKRFLLKDGIKIRTAEQNSVRRNDDALPQSEVTNGVNSKEICSVPNLEGNLSTPYIKQTLTNKKKSKIKVYQCEYCLVRAKHRSLLEKHLLVHKDPSEVTMYKCDSCSFQTKHKSGLKKHSLVHKNPSEVTMYKCDSCSFETKDKYYLKIHLLKHKDPSEVTMYTCDSCSFQTKYNGDLRTHLLKHKDPSDISVYDCGSCSYQTDQIYRLKRHLLTHKDPLDVKMYKCDSCSYQTKNRGNLHTHLLCHKNPSEVTIYKCNTCPYQTRFKGVLKQHMVSHKDPSEVTMYKCAYCSFETKYKHSLRSHSLMIHHNSDSTSTFSGHSTCVGYNFSGRPVDHLFPPRGHSADFRWMSQWHNTASNVHPTYIHQGSYST